MSREKVKTAQNAEEQQQPVKRRRIKAWSIIQWFLIPLLLVAALGGGLVVGYVILGKRN